MFSVNFRGTVFQAFEASLNCCNGAHFSIIVVVFHFKVSTIYVKCRNYVLYFQSSLESLVNCNYIMYLFPFLLSSK